MKQADGNKSHSVLGSQKDNTKAVDENIKLRDELKDL